MQLRPCDYRTFPDVASTDGVARHLAISECPNADREWVKLLKRFLDEE